MSKAVLILPEMPERCADCILVDLGDYGRDYCAKTERCIHDMNKKPDWCPLWPLPEEKIKKHVCFENDRLDNFIAFGWNQCLKEIEGSGEDASF